jgi:hypothetical protein
MRPSREHRHVTRAPESARRPGMWLRALAGRLCDASAMTHLIDPIVADLQHEHAEALREGAAWRGRRVRLASSFALIKVLILVQGGHVIEDLRQLATNESVLARGVRYSLIAMAVATAALVLPPLLELWRVDPMLALYVVPQALPLSIPFGLIVGIPIAFGGRVIPRRLAVHLLMLGAVCSVLTFVMFGWIVPSSNYAYQVRAAAVAPRAVTLDGAHPFEPLKGPHELTLPEFRDMYVRVTSTGIATGLPDAGWKDLPSLWFDYHLRWSLPCASLVFVLTALAAARHRRAVRITVSLAAAAAYACLFWLFASSNALSVASPGVLAWLPNILVAGAALAWMASTHERPDPPVIVDPTDRLLPT